MANFTLWEQLAELKSPKYKWVDLSHELSPETPHWYGFQPLAAKLLFDYTEGTPENMAAPMRVHEFTFASQYGTHVDAPVHFHGDGRSTAEIGLKELALPLCVVDVSAKVAANPDYALTIEDLTEWEAKYGKIPEGAFVAMRTDWYKRGADLDNNDAEGNAHYPGWKLDAVKWLVEERNIGAIGHEPSDTDPPTLADQVPFKAEDYILEVDRFQIEMMRGFDQVPAVGAVIFCIFMGVKNATGFPARCFAICPVE